jgi:hypothetical protein
MTTDTIPADSQHRVRDAATAAWLAGQNPPLLSRLLHPEVRHPGACYGTRAWRAVLLGLFVAIGGDLSYATGQARPTGHLDLMPFGPVWTLVAVLAVTGLTVLAAAVTHALSHRADAPYAYNTARLPGASRDGDA